MKFNVLFWLVLIVFLAVALWFIFSRLPASKKRYFKYLSQQLPHLLSRYFV